jgi:Leucine-rich repeat (LRR) protein
MKSMRSNRNVDIKSLSLISRLVIVFLQSLVLTNFLWLGSRGDSTGLPVPPMLPILPVLRWPAEPKRPQFVSPMLPLSKQLSLQSLAELKPTLSPKPDPKGPIAQPLANPKLSNESNPEYGCAPLEHQSFCSCYALDNGLLIDCKITAIYQMKDVLNLLISQPIKSFSVLSINQTLNSLPETLFQSFSSIEQMYISLPSLANLSVESLRGLETSLKTLSLVNSKLKAIPKTALAILKSLSTLDLESNLIQEVDAYAFHGIPLVSLNLQSNQINSLLEFSFGGLENTLVELILIDNKLERFPLHALRRLKRLETLKLQSNQISDIPDDGITRLSALKSLDLHSNQIHHLDTHSLVTTPRLVTLSVANNKLTVLSDGSAFEHLLDLETLDLSHNELQVVVLSQLKTLRSLDLSNNNLHDIRFQSLHNMKEVFLSNNNIQKLTNETFVNTSRLSVIFLQHNAIQSIDYNTFHNLHHLSTLDLSYNQLKAIDAQLLKHNTLLQSLYLDNNPFHCDCRLLSLYDWLSLHSRLLELNDKEDMVCSQPPPLKDQSLLTLHAIDLCPVPVISLMEISKLESTQVSTRWEVQNDTLVGGFTLEYYLPSNKTPPISQKFLGPSERQLDITDLKPENLYMVCVQANGLQSGNTGKADDYNSAQYLSSAKKCSQVRTLSNSERSVISLQTMGLIVSIVVFVVLLITLWTILFTARKSRAKRRRPLKSQSQEPEEYITYRHFSLPSSENVYS